MEQQVLYREMVELIDYWKIEGVSEDEKSIWRTAASRFRLPYWDWA